MLQSWPISPQRLLAYSGSLRSFLAWWTVRNATTAPPGLDSRLSLPLSSTSGIILSEAQVVLRTDQMVHTDDTIQVVTDSDSSGTSDMPVFQPCAAYTQQQPQQHSDVSTFDDVSTIIAQRAKSPMVTYHAAKYQQLCKHNTEQNFLITYAHLQHAAFSGWWIWSYFRRVLRPTSMVPQNFDESASFTQLFTDLYDFHIGRVTFFP